MYNSENLETGGEKASELSITLVFIVQVSYNW